MVCNVFVGHSGGAGEMLYRRTVLGHLINPLVKYALLLEVSFNLNISANTIPLYHQISIPIPLYIRYPSF